MLPFTNLPLAVKSNKSKSPGSSGSKNFELVLDHSQLSVTSVEEIKVPESHIKQTFDCSPGGHLRLIIPFHR